MTVRSTLAATLTLGAALIFALPSPASGQELESGTWTGTVTPPDGDIAEVTFEVSISEGTLQLSIVPPAYLAMEPFQADEVRFEEGLLTFSWNPGTLLDCELLEQEDGSLAGECVDPSGTSGFLTMVPPGEADPEDPARA